MIKAYSLSHKSRNGLYNAKLSKTPMLYMHWNLFVDTLEALLEKYETVDIATMGFPKNWKELLEYS